MTDLLRQGAEWLARQRSGHCASPVIYRPLGGADEIELSATFGRTDYQVADESGFEVGAFVWDFLIEAAALGREPSVGDVILADGHLYEVLRLADEPWRWSDAYRTTCRIHTREMGPV